MPNKNYLTGVRLERARKKFWEESGFVVIRASGSHGAFDLVALPKVNTGTKAAAIQCKRVSTDAEAHSLANKWLRGPKLTSQHEILEIQVKGAAAVDSIWR